jgi:hypothetical protein
VCSQQEKFKLANEFVANGGKHKTLLKILARLFAFVFTCLHGRCVRESRRPFAQELFFVANFRHLATKKKGLANPTNGFLRISLKNSPYLEKKKLEVARFRQCVSLGRQNQAGFQKRSTSSPGQSPFIAN